MRQDWERTPRKDWKVPDKSSFSRSFWWTILVVGGPALVSVAGAAFEPIYFLWFIAVLLAVGGIIVAIVECVYGRSNAASGIVAGVATSALILTVTCFANIRTMGPLI